MKRFLMVVLVIGFAFFGMPRFVSAFALEPGIIELSADPGETVQTNITIINDEPESKTYFFSVQKFIPKGSFGQQEFLPETDRSGLPSWIVAPSSSITLQPGQVMRAPIEIVVPENATPGGYYAAIFFSTVTNASPTNSQGETVGLRTGSLLLFTVNGSLAPKYYVRDFLIDHVRVYNSLPIRFTIRILNNGRTHVQPTGHITIRNMFGAHVATLLVNADGGRVLPNSLREFSSVWEEESVESQDLFTAITEELQHFAFGSYTAELEMVGPGSEENRKASVKFSVRPRWTFVVAFIVIAFVSLSVIVLARVRGQSEE